MSVISIYEDMIQSFERVVLHHDNGKMGYL